MGLRIFTTVGKLLWYYCSPVCSLLTQCIQDLILSCLCPSYIPIAVYSLSLNMDYLFFFFFLVSCSILLSMVIQQLVEILELLQKRWVHALLLHHLELRSDLWQNFYGFISWSNRNKNNSKQIRCNWTWKLFHSKGSHKQTTTKCPVEGEKKFANDETLNKLISRRYKYLMQLFHTYIWKHTKQKMVRKSKKAFLQKDIQMAKCTWKKRSTPNYWEKLRSKLHEVSPHSDKNGQHQKYTNDKCCIECGEKRTLLHSWWECSLVQPLWKRVWKCFKNLKIELPCDPALQGIYVDKTII